MTRLWDKGASLDERVLRYTAGEDHALDNRLVAYDVRASIAHAEMLHECGLVSAADLEAIRGGVRRVHVISYAAPDALLAEIFTNEGTGTLVVADTKALSAAEQGAG